ncbi:hypothetical protein M434DRAFT_8190 [Hypoxylon sp. CO27-5]|nr:hypothetical protein M434DRAFT_8190 [Hypoxylon sp. CO27-5]
MEQRTLKKLAPAPGEPSSSVNHSQASFPVPGPRKNLTRNACSQCKVKKAKCDGNRPSCGRCQKTGDVCAYEVNRRDIARLQLLSDYDINRLQSHDQVWAALQNGTDQHAFELLAQIRLGISVEALASAVNTSNTQPSNSASSNQPTFEMSSSSVATRDDSETHSTTTSQSFMDLLHNQDDWYQSNDGADNTDGTSYHIQEE